MPRTPAQRPPEMRRHNLSVLLREIHQHGAQSRAELTMALGLNRSTIGALVADLVELGLVTEHIPASRDRVGRPSHVVAPRPDGPYVLAVEVAVGQVISAAVGLGGVIHAQRETPIRGRARAPRAVAKLVGSDARWLAEQLPPTATRVGVGVSVPGTVRESDGFVTQAPNLEWRNVAFGSMLSDELDGQEAHVGNDANLGAVAEYQRGVAERFEHMVFVNGTVGVGAGIISAGGQIRGAGGYAGEIGHMTLDPDGPACHCGSNGCVETYLGEQALLEAAGIADGHSPDAVSDVFRRAAAGDALACAAVDRVALWLGRTLANVVNIFNPQAVVISGSLAEVMRLGSGVVEAELSRRAMSAARGQVSLLRSALDSRSCLIGAAEVAFAPLLAAPDSADFAMRS